jgi:hypothetical protein
VRVSGATNFVSTNGATLYITGIQLEKGTIATPFEFRPYAVELELCQRYFEKSYALETKPGTVTTIGQLHQRIVVTGNYFYIFPQIFYKIAKRAANPIIKIYSTTSGNAGVWKNDRVGDQTVVSNDSSHNISSFFVYLNTAYILGDGIFLQWTSESEL